MFKFAALALSTLISLNAFAIDSARCPETLSLKVDVEKVYQTSIYSKLPGWSEAQSTLNSLGTVETELQLHARTNVCTYQDLAGNKATLSTASFQDPDERSPSLVDQLVLNLKIENSTYVSFVPVKSYGPQALSLYSQPYSIKIKTRLYVPKTKRWANIDLGQIRVSVK